MIRTSAAVLACVAAVALAGCGSSQSSTSVSAQLGAAPLSPIKPPAIIPGPFNGLPTPRARAMRRPLAVILENYAPDSRPQSGLAAASTVIETLAEAGITRFMAIYLENDATKVGPVRSTRMYFDHWASGYHTILAHVGGNDDAQARLWHLPDVFNIDENRWERSLYNTGTPLFWRSSDRVPPHNMYTSTYKLRAYANQNRQDWAYTGAYLAHHPAAPLKSRGVSSDITINWMDPLGPQPEPAYDVKYVYDRGSNTYERFMGGAPHIDSNTGQPLRPANVIVARTGNASPDPNAGPTFESILIPVLGQGQAWFFENGHVTSGTWKQPNEFAPPRFYDRSGREIQLNPGQTWIEFVPASSQVSWSVR